VSHQIAAGVSGLIIGGTTGEGHLMSWDEHIMLIAHTVNQFGSAIKVIGNTGSNSTREAVHATEQGFAVGMHAALQINPYYGKTSTTGLHAHFTAALAEGPGIIYNVPGRTGQDIPDDVILALASHPNFLGVKECTGNDRIANYHSQGVVCWSGNDDEAHTARHQYNGNGVISVASNLIPGLFKSLMERRDDAQAEQLQELIAWLFCEPNPIALYVL
jgi:4-hydroxy-tetrahydrodipicolinate synthase